MKRLNVFSAALLLALLFFVFIPLPAQNFSDGSVSPREHLLMDFNWKFALGNASDPLKDFGSGTGYFTYFAKAGYGDGPASKTFGDQTWRTVNLPHDWAVELPFSGSASHSHGYKTLGYKYPETSVGWYRKVFTIPQSDLGRRISIQFDGIYRDAIVWVNGFYLGREHSGYASVEYDITDYLNYGGENVVAVRVDASLEEGWFYEGAGIYRHVWLNKTAPLHVAQYGTFISSAVSGEEALLSVKTTVINENRQLSGFTLEQKLLDARGKEVAETVSDLLHLDAGAQNEFDQQIKVTNPTLWDLDSPYLYTVVTTVKADGQVTDRYQTTIGIRTLRFDANEGFFLNGKSVKIKGTNNHQDHAGVGAAIPDALQEYRIARLKEMGSNAYRCSHNPATPELLDACDRLGMLVMDENRLMGTNQEHFDLLKRMMLRDRNHPSVILWSMGNEEWAIEGNITGQRIAATMLDFAHKTDPTRLMTVALSGGWGSGISNSIDVMGYNYLTHGNIDEYHAQFPAQPAVGTEETTTSGSRGIYVDDRSNGRMAATDRTPNGASVETGWKYYAERPFLAGLFFWTGFDYRGEPNPLNFPATGSQFGIIDYCGFPKDVFYYLKSWWGEEPVLHVFPHWNQTGKEGQPVNVWAYSNCDELELILNKKSLGKKKMPLNGHLEWSVNYQPGVLLAKGYKNGKEILRKQVETTGNSASVQLISDKKMLKTDAEDVAVITVQAMDAQGRFVPTAMEELTFTLQGPGKIIGVGNGDPAFRDPEKYLETIRTVPLENWRRLGMETFTEGPETGADFDDSSWQSSFTRPSANTPAVQSKVTLYRAGFEMDELSGKESIALLIGQYGENQTIYLNGEKLDPTPGSGNKPVYQPESEMFRKGKNSLAIVATAFSGEGRRAPRASGTVLITTPAAPYACKLFNGLTQVIVQSSGQAGDLVLSASAPGITSGEITLGTIPVKPRPALP